MIEVIGGNLFQWDTGRVAQVNTCLLYTSEKLEAEKERLMQPEIAVDYAKILEITEEIGKQEKQLQDYYTEWEKLSEQL